MKYTITLSSISDNYCLIYLQILVNSLISSVVHFGCIKYILNQYVKPAFRITTHSALIIMLNSSVLINYLSTLLPMWILMLEGHFIYCLTKHICRFQVSGLALYLMHSLLFLSCSCYCSISSETACNSHCDFIS